MQREGSRRYAKMRQVMADCEFPRWGGYFPDGRAGGKRASWTVGKGVEESGGGLDRVIALRDLLTYLIPS